jgi:hypothetical protein
MAEPSCDVTGGRKLARYVLDACRRSLRMQSYFRRLHTLPVKRCVIGVHARVIDPLRHRPTFTPKVTLRGLGSD